MTKKAPLPTKGSETTHTMSEGTKADAAVNDSGKSRGAIGRTASHSLVPTTPAPGTNVVLPLPSSHGTIDETIPFEDCLPLVVRSQTRTNFAVHNADIAPTAEHRALVAECLQKEDRRVASLEARDVSSGYLCEFKLILKSQHTHWLDASNFSIRHETSKYQNQVEIFAELGCPLPILPLPYHPDDFQPMLAPTQGQVEGSHSRSDDGTAALPAPMGGLHIGEVDERETKAMAVEPISESKTLSLRGRNVSTVSFDESGPLGMTLKGKVIDGECLTIVTKVKDGSQAAKAGIRQGDIFGLHLDIFHSLAKRKERPIQVTIYQEPYEHMYAEV